MTFKVGIFVDRKDKPKLIKWLPERYPSHREADDATERKNRDLGNVSDVVLPGHKYAMYDAV